MSVSLDPECPQVQTAPPVMPPELSLSWEYEEHEQPLIEQDPLPWRTSEAVLSIAIVGELSCWTE